MKRLAAALAAGAFAALPLPPAHGADVVAALGNAQAKQETQQGFAVTADCKVTGTLNLNGTLELLLVLRGVSTGPGAIVANETAARCVISDGQTSTDVYRVNGGAAVLHHQVVRGYLPGSLTLCAQGFATFVQAGVNLQTAVVCAPILLVTP